jgi:hypothetical protein
MKSIFNSLKRKIKRCFFPKIVVNFLICGTQKGGTSALFVYLKEHPEICMSDVKEVHYFGCAKHFANGKPDYAKYHAYFNPKKNQKIIGEATPSYGHLE